MRGPLALALGLLVALSALDVTVRADPRTVFVMIVNPRNRAASAERQFLEDAFLKKVTVWPDGPEIHPADLVAQSRVRREFSEEVLKRSVEAVKAYWQQRIFSGRDVPPPEFESDDDVVRYVLRYDGGVGYVSAGANIGNARVLSVR